MPQQLTYPGVYIEEVPSGVRTITGVATSITAFVGRAARGRTDEPIQINSFGDFEREFGGLWKESALGYSVRDFFLNGGSTAIVVRLYRAKTAENEKSSMTLVGTGAADDLVLTAANPGAWGNKLRARADYVTRKPDPALGETTANLFNLYLHDGGTGVTEEHRNVVSSPSTHPRFVTKVLENESHLARVTSVSTNGPDASAAPPAGKSEWDANTPATSATPDPATTPPTTATDGSELTKTEFNGANKESTKTGLFSLERTDLFNLLVIPPYKNFGLGTDSVDSDVITSADLLCTRRRAVQLIDPLPAWDEVGDLTTAFTSGFSTALGTTSKNAALFFPRLRQPNPLMDDQVQSFAPSGAVAGVIARTDSQRGVWKAPAGQAATLSGVPALSVPLTDAEIGQVNPLGVNCLRALPGAGRVVWGARTMEGADLLASEWKYLPVRRTALFLEETLFRGSQWVVFEPNDEPLWSQIRLNVGSFMNNLFRQGAFQGTTPAAAYFVKCDKETTTQAHIDAGIVNIHVGFAPLKPAEFVVVRLQQMAGQIA